MASDFTVTGEGGGSDDTIGSVVTIVSTEMSDKCRVKPNLLNKSGSVIMETLVSLVISVLVT